MQVTSNFYSVDFEQIPLDPFWNTGDGKECKMHRIHAYPAKFPAFITTKAIEFVKKRGVDVRLVADIFCGCGTVAHETKKNGLCFWGCDINPVATLIAETKSHIYNDEVLKCYTEAILNSFSSSYIEDCEIENVNSRIKYWFKTEQIKDLLILKKIIFSTVADDKYYLNFFLCAFSNILKATSVWLTKSIKPQVDPHKTPANVINSFVKQVSMMRWKFHRK
ncbi:hypothetical protein D0T51_11810 [Parabacteroides sp. 52]|uniref:DNA methyltransferase n=1 Tax=unclassified Parabacteroides TaxID=2649774 RepID=UPI0013D7FFDF|nr:MULTISPECIES: DNA methyltransferase [unclassified Parabacteroides]MDH6535056.1 adenine-specific DNA methylase [Parabacteroides sp. PM5-20]NDV56411.1 hypothetical protein [Parabacteroides sp. 52]